MLVILRDDAHSNPTSVTDNFVSSYLYTCIGKYYLYHTSLQSSIDESLYKASCHFKFTAWTLCIKAFCASLACSLPDNVVPTQILPSGNFCLKQLFSEYSRVLMGI